MSWAGPRLGLGDVPVIVCHAIRACGPHPDARLYGGGRSSGWFPDVLPTRAVPLPPHASPPTTVLRRQGLPVTFGSPALTLTHPRSDGQGGGGGPPQGPPGAALQGSLLLQAAKLHVHLTPQDTTATSLFVWAPGGQDPAPERRASRRDLPQRAKTAQPRGDGASPGTRLLLHSDGL